MTKKHKYIESDTIYYGMLDPKEVLGKKIVEIYLHQDLDGDELQLLLEDGKQIEISLMEDKTIWVQSD